MPTPVTVIPSDSASPDLLQDKTIAVLGYGAQGHAHAQNLRDAGLNVVVGQRSGGPRHAQAVADGFTPCPLAEAVQQSDLLIWALPDDAARELFPGEIEPHMRPGQTLGFIHGFVMHYKQITPPADCDVIMVAPKAQGRGVRREFLAGRGVLALIAIGQDRSGHARQTALGWAAGLGCHRAGLLETTFADETETDLFGEQAVLCGGLSTLIQAGFDTLVEAGYPEELAYFECCHEVKLLVDLIYEHGISATRGKISTTARYGDLTRGRRVIDDATRTRMREVLAEIRNGSFAKEFLADRQAGGPTMEARMREDEQHAIEQVGRRLRDLMWGTPEGENQ